MKNFKYILFSSIAIYALNFLAHFIFDIISLDIIAVFFPTNESIFQHMKMIFSCFFIFYLILFIVRRKFNFENIFLTNLTASISTICIFLIVYLPIYFRFGENMIFTFILLLISIFLGQLISSIFLRQDEYHYSNIISIIIISIIFIIFGYLTYNPLENFLFWDPESETYERVYK